MKLIYNFLLLGLFIIPMELKSQKDRIFGDFNPNQEITEESIFSFKLYREKLLKDPTDPHITFAFQKA